MKDECPPIVRLTKEAAVALASKLLPCPFCGQFPVARIQGAGEYAKNPSARCTTEACMGSRLPGINLDVPADVAAWNQRV
jgi:hypothetical protein